LRGYEALAAFIEHFSQFEVREERPCTSAPAITVGAKIKIK
jgi:hypothetical protein